MSKLLVIHSSPRAARSHSRTLANTFVQQWSEKNPGATITEKDLGHEPVAFVSESWIIGAFAPAEYQSEESKAAIAVSDVLVDQFLAADKFVFSVPMYNLNVPATFKAYIDQIIRVGRTFGVGEQGYYGLVQGKKALFVTASGGAFRAGTPSAGYNFQEPYLRAIFGFIGVTDVEFVVADNQNVGDEAAAETRTSAAEKLTALASTW